MKLLQIVITKEPDGDIRITEMGLNDSGKSETLSVEVFHNNAELDIALFNAIDALEVP